MKKVFYLFFICLLFTSCYPNLFYKRSSYVDFSKYEAEGFYINTLTNVNFEYHNQGIIEVVVRDGMVRVDGKEINLYFKSKQEHDNYINSKKEFKYATFEDALTFLVETCKEKGCNGIIGLEMNILPEYKTEPGGVILRAIAIKK